MSSLITKKRLKSAKKLEGICYIQFLLMVLSFHRVNQMVSWFQGGGFEPGMTQKENRTAMKTSGQRFKK